MTEDRLIWLRDQTLTELEGNILPFWMERMKDPSGGFYGRIDGLGNLVPDADKGGILNARILWTFSSAYRIFRKPEYASAAERARQYLAEHFIDTEYGGIYWTVKADGTPADTHKQFYAIAFAVYAFSEHFRATGDRSSLELAVSLFRTIEDHSKDPVYGGYIEACARDWQPTEDMRLSEKEPNFAKTMNTHLHILEGYTGLYRVWKTPELHDSLRDLILIHLDRIAGLDGHLQLFFDMDWTLRSSVRSFGHDIEASWLLVEAAEVLGDADLIARTREECGKIADAGLEGFSIAGGMMNEWNPSTRRLDGDRDWWVQAETVVGCLYRWKISGDRRYLTYAEAAWRFIRNFLVCPDGEWYWSLRDDGTPNTDDDRAGFWKCPYHSGRMCMEIFSYICNL